MNCVKKAQDRSIKNSGRALADFHSYPYPRKNRSEQLPVAQFRGPEERAACIRKAAEDKIRYQEEMGLWLEDHKFEICTTESADSCERSPKPESNESSLSSGRGEATLEALVLGTHFLSNPLRNTPYTMSQNVSLELRRLDFVELDVNASAEEQRRRRQIVSPRMDRRRNQTPLNLLSKRSKHLQIERFTHKNLRTVVEDDAHLIADNPSLEYCSMQLELDDEICFSEY